MGPVGWDREGAIQQRSDSRQPGSKDEAHPPILEDTPAPTPPGGTEDWLGARGLRTKFPESQSLSFFIFSLHNLVLVPRSHCVTLGKSPTLSELHFPRSPPHHSHQRLKGEAADLTPSAQCLAHGKRSVSAGYLRPHWPFHRAAYPLCLWEEGALPSLSSPTGFTSCCVFRSHWTRWQVWELPAARGPGASWHSAGPWPPDLPRCPVPEATPAGRHVQRLALPFPLRLAGPFRGADTPAAWSGPDSSGWLALGPRLIQTSSSLFINSIPLISRTSGGRAGGACD